MIMDKLLEFDPSGTALTVTAASTNVLDAHGASLIPAFSSTVKPGRDMGAGGGLITPKLVVLITTTFGAGGAATLQVQFQGAPDNGSGAPGTYVTYAESPARALADLVAGNRILDIDWPRIAPSPNTPALLPRFYRLNYIVATGPMTSGALGAWIVLGRDDQVAYIPGVTVAN